VNEQIRFNRSCYLTGRCGLKVSHNTTQLSDSCIDCYNKITSLNQFSISFMLFLPYLNGHQRFEDYSKQRERTEMFPNIRKRSLFFEGSQDFIFCPSDKKSMMMKTSTEQWWKEWKLDKKLQSLRGYCNFYSVSPSRVQFLARIPRAVTFSRLFSSLENSRCSTSIHAVNISSHMSITVQQDANIYTVYYIYVNCSTCFGW